MFIGRVEKQWRVVCFKKNIFHPNSSYSEVYKIYFSNKTVNNYLSVDKNTYGEIQIGDSMIVFYKQGLFEQEVVSSYEKIPL